MGVIRHKDVFTSKYVTAIISDSNDRVHFLPIKYTFDNYFITELNGNMYGFSLKDARILTYREVLSRSIKIIEYDTSHFKSINAKMQKELELVLKKNMLPKVNRLELMMLRILGQKESLNIYKTSNKIKQNLEQDPEYRFSQHDLTALIKELKARQKDFPEETQNMIEFIEDLDIDHIVTPVRRISEYLQEDLITTPPSFFGEALPRYQRIDRENKGVTNKPITAKIAWLKWIMVITFVTFAAFIIYFGYEQGWFNFITNILPNPDTFKGIPSSLNPPSLVPQKDECSDEALQKKYSPVELKIAIQEGRETCKLSPTMQKLVDGVKLPIAIPKE